MWLNSIIPANECWSTINRLYTSISWPISAAPPLPAESLVLTGAFITEPNELEVETDCAWVDADWRAGFKPEDSTISTRDVITPKVYQNQSN